MREGGGRGPFIGTLRASYAPRRARSIGTKTTQTNRVAPPVHLEQFIPQRAKYQAVWDEVKATA